MPVTVVVGGQFGSEGKGKVAHFFAQQQHASVADIFKIQSTALNPFQKLNSSKKNYF